MSTESPVERLAVFQQAQREAAEAVKSAEARARAADEALQRARIQERDAISWAEESKHDADEERAEEVRALARKCAAEDEQANDALIAAKKALRAATDAARTEEMGGTQAVARVAALRAQLDAATEARGASAARAEKAAVFAKDEEAKLARFAEAATLARDRYDADARTRDAFVKAKSAHDDARISVERAHRLANDAKGEAVIDRDAWCRARAELAMGETSPGMVRVRLSVAVDKMREAFLAYIEAHVEAEEVRKELGRVRRDGLIEAGLSTDANARLRTTEVYMPSTAG